MYHKAWVTNLTALIAAASSMLGGYTGAISAPEAVAGVVGAGSLLGLGRKLEAIRQAAIVAGQIAQQIQPPPK
jgi:hypothetical protein